MKKMMSLVLVLMLLAMSCSAAFAQEITGTWYGDMMGIPMTMTLAEDGTYTMEIMGEVDEGTWVLEENTLYTDKGTEGEVALAYDAEANAFVLNMEGIEVAFTREAVETFTPAAVRQDATLADFAGHWEASHIFFMEMLLPVEMAGGFMSVDVDGVNVTMAISMGGEETEPVTLEGIYAQGTLSVIIPAESELSEDSVFTLLLLEDGMLSCTTSMMEMPLIFYLNAVEAEEVPAA